MKQFIIALLLKLKTRYSEREELLNELMRDYEIKTSDVNWVVKTGVLNNKTEDLFARLSPEDREDLFVKLFKKIYPNALMSKHPSKQAYLFKIGETKFFYDVLANNIVIPMGDDEPRTFNAGLFFENMPKLDEFLKYLNTYSLRNRKTIFN